MERWPLSLVQEGAKDQKGQTQLHPLGMEIPERNIWLNQEKNYLNVLTSYDFWDLGFGMMCLNNWEGTGGCVWLVNYVVDKSFFIAQLF